MNFLVVALLAVLPGCFGSPKDYNKDQLNFEPSHKYYETSLSKNGSKHDKEFKESNDRLRFGIPISSSFGSTGNGVQYGQNGVSYMVSPMKIDIGGIALGALIGLGAVLVVPKLAQVFSGGYGGYRTLESDMSSISSILAKVEDSLEQQNIDTKTCMQRVICSYINDAKTNINEGKSNNLDEFIFALSNNTMFNSVLRGTPAEQAIKLGKADDLDSCSLLQKQCPFTKEKMLAVISNFLPSLM